MSTDNVPDASLYHCWTIGVGEERARADYVRAHGEQPQRIYTFAGLIWLGPVDKESKDNG